MAGKRAQPPIKSVLKNGEKCSKQVLSGASDRDGRSRGLKFDFESRRIIRGPDRFNVLPVRRLPLGAARGDVAHRHRKCTLIPRTDWQGNRRRSF